MEVPVRVHPIALVDEAQIKVVAVVVVIRDRGRVVLRPRYQEDLQEHREVLQIRSFSRQMAAHAERLRSVALQRPVAAKIGVGERIFVYLEEGPRSVEDGRE